MADIDLPPGVDPPSTSMASQDTKAAEEGSEQNSQRSAEEPKKKNLYADEYDLDADNPLAGSDDEEDGIQVTIGKIEPVVSFSMKHATHERQHTSKLDLDSLPRIGDTPIYDVDLASMDDRPWRKPGADITDYFNYGFTEETWNTYCERQKKLRSEFTSQAAVNKALFSNIYLANPLGMPVMGSRNISTIGDGPSTVKVLTDNGGRFKAHHHGMNNEPVVRTVIGAPSNVSGPPGVGTPTTGPPPMDFSKPPPGMSLPPPTVPVLGVPPGMSDGVPGMDGPPGVGGPPGLDGPPGIDVSSSSIPTVGSGAALDMSLPPPGFNPSLPPPGMTVRPPPIGMPTMNIGSAGFNSMLPPPAYSQVRYPMGSGGGIGRPPPLMGRDFGRDGDMDDDRRNRRRSRSRSPRRSDRDRRRDDDRRDRDRKDRDRERSERSSRRHRSRSREDRDKRRDRKDDDSDRKRRRHDRDDDDERRERRRRRDEERSPDRNSQERGGSHDEEAAE